MKKTICALVAAILLPLMAMATNPTFAGKKIYLNPGHGGWNSANDRNIPTIPFGAQDTLGFWESSSNLKVGLDLYKMLTDNGATVRMSRWTNQSGTRDNGATNWDGTTCYTTDSMVGDRSLAMIAHEATNWGADAFLSIHSNAAGNAAGKACNYLVFFLPGTGYNAGWQFTNYAKSIDTTMARIAWPHLLDNPLDVWSEASSPSNPNMPNETDYTLCNNGNLGCPGFICEASFHTYLPNTHRYLNRDYQYLEALRFYYFYCDYFQVELPTTGVLCGDVRSADYRMRDKGYLAYIPGSKDQWKPLNGAVVTLLDATQDTVISVYTCDNFYNGLYCFRDLQPGQYKVRYEYTDPETGLLYTPQEQLINVPAGKITYNNIRLKDDNHESHAGCDTLPDFQEYGLGHTMTMPTTLYLDVAYNIPMLDTMTIRRMLIRGEKTYVLNDHSQIFVFSTADGTLIRQLSTEGVEFGSRLLSDIAFTADSVLFACNSGEIADSQETGGFRLYKWTSDDAEPKLVFEIAGSEATGGWATATCGETMALSGNSYDFRVYFPATYIAVKSGKQRTRLVGVHYNADFRDVELCLYKYNTKNTDAISSMRFGVEQHYTLSPLAGNRIIIDGPEMLPLESEFDWTTDDGQPLTEIAFYAVPDAATFGGTYIQYAGKKIFVTPELQAEKAMIRLYDVTAPDTLQALTEPYAIGPESAAMASISASVAAETAVPSYFATGAYLDVDGVLAVAAYAKGQGMSIYRTAETTGYNQTNYEMPVYTYGVDGRVIVECQPGSPICIYSADGRLLVSENASSDISAYMLGKNQTVIVTVAGKAHKVQL